MNNESYTLRHNDIKEIQELLMWRTVTKVSDNTIELDNGTVLEIHGNEGGCSCGAGDYILTELNDSPVNAITAVEFDYEPGGAESNDWNGHYRIFVYAQNEEIKLMEVTGTDGNGYYGTGYWIKVTMKEQGDKNQENNILKRTWHK